MQLQKQTVHSLVVVRCSPKEIKAAVQQVAEPLGIDVDARLRTAIETSIENYARPLRAADEAALAPQALV
ncbi:hypothetical protein GCM10022402_36170 [Salinactinospora qingdaonensis]|uniref:Uncharacterized protein n=1 Tax=Salinactinospora qingdaonensis TaxID=702744 RepID=A0ABP7G233_9ACTN